MIAVVDYAMGNLGSVAKALTYLGYPVQITQDAGTIQRADRLILPGVGAIGYAMQQLRRFHLDQAIRTFCQSGRPFLGICLGMQLMLQTSDEGASLGLGILPGAVRKLEAASDIKIPHIGWNQIETSRVPLIEEKAYYYFVHSYHAVPAEPEKAAATAWHGQTFAAAIQYDNVLLTQFHPEKSGKAGLKLLHRWMQD